MNTKVMIVDDSRTYQSLLSSHLDILGFRYVTAKSGEEALKIFSQERPDLILLDVNMPGINGYETARRIRTLEEEWAGAVPIMFLSAAVEDKDIVRGIEAGGDDYLCKPLSETILNAKIKAMLRMGNQRKERLELAKSLARANHDLEIMSRTDDLTGTCNKRYFNECLQKAWFHCMRHQSPLSLLFIDLDHFKSYNDSYGHLQGDMCLKKVALSLHENISRNADMLFRFGGEQFVMLLPDTDLNGMHYMGEMMVQSVRNLTLPHEGSSTADTVTISIGGDTMIPQQSATSDTLIKQADQALYHAKEEGRDRFLSAQQSFVPHYLWNNHVSQKVS